MSVVVPEEAEKKAIYPPQILHAWIGGHTPNSFFHQLKSKVLGQDEELKKAAILIYGYIVAMANSAFDRKFHFMIEGSSGCGKSTIVALICKLYDPCEGTILFDDINSRALAQEFGKNVSMVNQNPYLFNLTIRENMRLVKDDVTDEEIFNALKLANAYDFVKELPLGLDSFLGEGGTRLSGGQKQRICIARALLKDSKVIIFDEATSALDNISQEYVINSIETLKQNKTIITIAHRLSTIESCDTIYFIDKGKIVDYGTHKYLLKHNTKYATLYNKQKKDSQDKLAETSTKVDTKTTKPKTTKTTRTQKAKSQNKTSK